MLWRTAGVALAACFGGTGDTKDADEVYTIHGPERTLEAIDASMPTSPSSAGGTTSR